MITFSSREKDKMNRVVTILATILLLASFQVFAQETERIDMSVGDVKILETPFNVETYTQTPKGKIISVEAGGNAENKLSVTALEQGECTLRVNGHRITKIYHISVLSNIRKLLSKLHKDLQDLPELEIVLNQDSIIINGTLNSQEKWKHLQNVVKLYGEEIRNFVKFRPNVESILTLKKLFVAAGYPVSDTPDCNEGELYLKITNDALLLQGKLFSDGEIAEIKSILGTQDWLVEPPALAGKFPILLKLSTVTTQVAVDVAFVALTKEEGESLGSKGGISASFNFNRVWSLVSGSSASKSCTVGVDIGRTLEFLEANGVGRIHNAGTVTFTNNSTGGGHLKVGGTNYVPVESGMTEISYGFDVRVKGTQTSRKEINLNLVLENSSMMSDLHKVEWRTETDRTCEFDSTTIIGGYRGIVESTANSGIPVLRKIPVLKWFVSGSENQNSSLELLMLICPRLVTKESKVQIDKVAEQNADKMLENGTMNNGDQDKSKKRKWQYTK